MQGSQSNGYVSGSVEWWEHEQAYEDYSRRYGTRQSAERIAERAGFSYAELVDHLGHEPTTWMPRAATSGGPT